MGGYGFGKKGKKDTSKRLRETQRERETLNRVAAVYALMYMESPEAVELLIEALGDESHLVRILAAIALGIKKNPKAVEPLIGVLRDESPEVRKACAEILERLTGKHFGVNFKRWWEWLQGEMGDASGEKSG